MSELPLGDPHMEAARLLAIGLGPAPSLPRSLAAIDARADFVNKVDGIFRLSQNDITLFRDIGLIIAKLAAETRIYLPGIKSALARVNLALRLWSGCISGAKVIALETRSGPNTPETRARDMPRMDAIAAQDPIYAAGMEAAPAFKRLRNEEFSFEGIPSGSRILRGKA